jgi:hypothetical protein
VFVLAALRPRQYGDSQNDAREGIVMTDMMVGVATLVMVFLLIVILGLEMQISTNTRRIEDMLRKLTGSKG